MFQVYGIKFNVGDVSLIPEASEVWLEITQSLLGIILRKYVFVSHERK